MEKRKHIFIVLIMGMLFTCGTIYITSFTDYGKDITALSEQLGQDHPIELTLIVIMRMLGITCLCIGTFMAGKLSGQASAYQKWLNEIKPWNVEVSSPKTYWKVLQKADYIKEEAK